MLAASPASHLASAQPKEVRRFLRGWFFGFGLDFFFSNFAFYFPAGYNKSSKARDSESTPCPRQVKDGLSLLQSQTSIFSKINLLKIKAEIKNLSLI